MSISFNLGKKLIFLVLIVSIVTLSITAFLSFNYADQILKERAGDQLLGESIVRGDTLRLLFESRIEQNNILANDPMIQLLVSEMNQIPEDELKEFKESNRRDFLIQVQAFQELIGFSIGFEDTKIIGSNGKVFFSLSGISDENFIGDKFFQRGLKESFIEFESAEVGKKMIVVSPIFADDSKIGDEPIGVIISRMRTASIDNVLINRSGLGESGEVYIVNNQFLMLSESRFLENVVFQQKVDTFAVQQCFNNGEEFLGFYEDYRNVPIYGSSYCADDLGIVLLVEIDKAEVEKPIDILQDRIFQTGIVITIGMGIAAFGISKSLSRPLLKLKSAANKIASGDFEVRTNITTGDEIGELSHAFDSMAQKLQESLIEIKEKEDVIKQQEDILLKFSQHEQNDCVGVIDMTDSTRISSKLSDDDVSKMYEIFLNFMAKIVRKHNGEVVKNIGDALMFRFANVDSKDTAAMKNILECCLSMIEAHDELKKELNAENIDALDYKISATYGAVKVAESTTSKISDIFGPTVNRCFKINSLCPKNSIVVGINLYEILKDFDEYEFTQFCSIEMKKKYGYSIFEVRRK
ncbi:adenylate/guanylate cyclase domain-containing protein [Nitrosopumilus cobalaminigenes]|uniref:histidine kinase n=1 Tax=Nitrosopumilus cobalaminigenes TaxID=1470066 RepID=A0A7D5M071_9ARCH|nr:HAMP domain-containing protein [Nitrosopumilus cobalaminigenes]QLH03686.1 adenylate/guanylate cyclase domain-containing protein [Nitrosopumilus cobalaminigenes]